MAHFCFLFILLLLIDHTFSALSCSYFFSQSLLFFLSFFNFQVFDGVLGVGGGVLRGCGRQRLVAMVLHSATFFLSLGKAAKNRNEHPSIAQL